MKWIKPYFPTLRKLLVEKSIKRHAPFNKFENILIIGSGEDPYRKYFYNYKKYICLDICKHKSTDIIGNALILPIKDKNFDLIFTSEVFEHLKDPTQFVNEAKRVLKPNGIIILTVPFLYHQHADPFDFWRPTRTTLENLFRGCTKINIENQGNRLHVILDLITTAFTPIPIFFPFRILNHIFINLFAIFDKKSKNSTAPCGFFLKVQF